MLLHEHILNQLLSLLLHKLNKCVYREDVRKYIFFLSFVFIMNFWSYIQWLYADIYAKVVPFLTKKSHETDVYTPQASSDTSHVSSSPNHVFNPYHFWFAWLVMVYIGYIVRETIDVLYLIFTGLIVSIALESMIVSLQAYISRGASILVSYLTIMIVVCLGMFVFIPFVIQQCIGIIDVAIAHVTTIKSMIISNGLEWYIQSISWLPTFLSDLMIANLSQTTVLYQSMQDSILTNISSIVSLWSSYTGQITHIAVNIIGSLFGILGQMWFVLTVAIFCSIEKNTILRVIDQYAGHNSLVFFHIDLLYKKLGSWLKSQFLLCVYIWLIVYVGLWVLDIIGIDLPHKETLAIIAWFTELIPYLWPLLGGIPALIIGTMTVWFPWFVGVSIVYYIIQWTENNILIPTLMNKSLGVSPLVIFLCMILGGNVLGVVGIFLAVPLAIIVTIVLDKHFR